LSGKTVIFVAQPDTAERTKFEKREVVVGISSGGWTAILSGLKRGDVVVIVGAYAVRAEFARAMMPKMEMD
jgi:multidrug efflux pump subunit AcrA (membrane-fusion protein)